MNAIIGYILLGVSLAAPIGPINAAQMDRGLKGGFLPAWFFGIGANMADIFYILCVYFGLVHFITVPIMKLFLWFFGAFLLFYTGIEGLMEARQLSESIEMRAYESHFRSFISGFLMSLSNPITILFWLGVYGSVLAEISTKFATYQLILYSGSIFLGLFVWDLVMATVSSAFRFLLTNRLIQSISIFSGLSLLGFGGYFGYQGVKLLFNF